MGVNLYNAQSTVCHVQLHGFGHLHTLYIIILHANSMHFVHTAVHQAAFPLLTLLSNPADDYQLFTQELGSNYCL